MLPEATCDDGDIVPLLYGEAGQPVLHETDNPPVANTTVPCPVRLPVTLPGAPFACEMAATG